ncbi:hypothetical protein ACIQYF_05210 [Pseudomonas sp. NPDC096917]|uniref:hypothetical protein n=1 Tax=Pseudomonas sp. NPDC096917 TaxID=3364483 RepID=UPI00383B170E
MATITIDPANTGVIKKLHGAPAVITIHGLAPAGACTVHVCCMATKAIPTASAHAAAPHRLASEYKKDVQAYLQGMCSQAGLNHLSQVALQLFIIGEGLIVATQVSGISPESLSGAREMAALLCSRASAQSSF